MLHICPSYPFLVFKFIKISTVEYQLLRPYQIVDVSRYACEYFEQDWKVQPVPEYTKFSHAVFAKSCL
jgi:hypothetical protein